MCRGSVIEDIDNDLRDKIVEKYMDNNPKCQFAFVSQHQEKVKPDWADREKVVHIPFYRFDSTKYSDCIPILYCFNDCPKYPNNDVFGVEDLNIMVTGNTSRLEDDGRIVWYWDSYRWQVIKKKKNDIMNHEAYCAGNTYLYYPLSRNAFKLFDKLIISTIKLDLSHYKHYIEQYNVKITRLNKDYLEE